MEIFNYSFTKNCFKTFIKNLIQNIKFKFVFFNYFVTTIIFRAQKIYITNKGYVGTVKYTTFT